MTQQELTAVRLLIQHLIPWGKQNEEEVVSWMGALQGQDYLSSRWAIGVRLPGLTEEKTEEAIREFRIIRSWIMRGTLHLTTAADIRWMLALLGPRLIKAGMPRNRQLELDEETFTKSNNILLQALEGGKQLTRDELIEIYENAGISTTGQRFIHLLQRAALEQLICFGPRRQKQFTFTLLDEAVPPNQPAKNREEALCELAGRYFQSRGPATLNDFVWWSGLSVSDARKGLEAAKPFLRQENFDGQAYYLPDKLPSALRGPKRSAWLLPAFDEYVIAYRDRSALMDKHLTKQVISVNGIFYPVIVVNGKVTGLWKRTVQKDKITVEINPFNGLSNDVREEIAASTETFGNFAGKTIEIK
ncbi:MAG: winged helix DNA-binding domain-containing protein [Prolixibacteraceae bacterium]